jgi:hypothetical protein
MGDAIPVADIPSLEITFARGGIHLESLQLFTPRGKNLLGKEFPMPDDINGDLKINEMIEEVKEEAEEDGHYGVEDLYKLERVATAS